MFKQRRTGDFGLLVDIGSGSVGIAVCDISTSPKPTIVWAHREHTQLKVTKSIDESSKAIATTLMTAMLLFESKGRAALHDYNSSGKISSIQTTVSAPWAYTVARTIHFEKDQAFVITEELLSELAVAAGEQALEEFNKVQSLKKLGVVETSRTVLDAYANGYRLTKVNHQKAKELKVTHVSTLVREEIIVALKEMQAKLFSSVPLHITSYMLANYYVVDALPPEGEDFCLVDITNEATEIGLIRNNTLQYSTHVAFGRASLAREVAAATGTPLHEAFTSLRTLDPLTSKNKDVAQAFTAYTNHVTELFKETGDRLTVPKYIYLQADAGLSSFFKPLIEKAGKQVSKSNVSVITIEPSDIQKQENPTNGSDVALSVGLRFFHTQAKRTYFKYL